MLVVADATMLLPWIFMRVNPRVFRYPVDNLYSEPVMLGTSKVESMDGRMASSSAPDAGGQKGIHTHSKVLLMNPFTEQLPSLISRHRFCTIHRKTKSKKLKPLPEEWRFWLEMSGARCPYSFWHRPLPKFIDMVAIRVDDD